MTAVFEVTQPGASLIAIAFIFHYSRENEDFFACWVVVGGKARARFVAHYGSDPALLSATHQVQAFAPHPKTGTGLPVHLGGVEDDSLRKVRVEIVHHS
jgi:hypothetical protein